MFITKETFTTLNNMNIHIYKTIGCGYCTKVIELMERAGIPYDSTLVGTDITREEFKELYPRASGFPYVIVDDEPIGGLTETVKLFVEKGLVSSKKK
jgi:glutaredoxin 3